MRAKKYSRSRSKALDLDSSAEHSVAPQKSEVLTPDQWLEKARSILLNRLSRGPRSKAQLRNLLEERQVPSEIAEGILDRFEEVGLIDDAKFAEAFARDKRQSRGLAKRALAQELKKVGVSPEFSESALEEFDQESEVELAITLVERRLATVSNLDWQSRQRRLYGYLGRRGFAANVIATAIARAEQGFVAQSETDSIS